jgi:hypothetical protein
MSAIAENFNKISADDPQAALKRDFERLPPDKRDIFLGFRAIADQEDVPRRSLMEEQRSARIASNANMLAGRAALEPGGERLHHVITDKDVDAMMIRAGKEEIPLEELTPHSRAETFIQMGHHNTMAYEAAQDKAHAQARFENERKLMDELLGLKEPEISKSIDLDNREHRQDRSITDEFNRAARTL